MTADPDGIEERIAYFQRLARDMTRAAAFSERASSEAVEISLRAQGRAKKDPYLIALARETSDLAREAHLASELYRLQTLSFDYHAKLYQLKKAAHKLSDYVADSRHKETKLRGQADELTRLVDQALDAFTD